MKQNWIVFNSKDKDFLFENFADLSLLTAMLKLPWVSWVDKFGINPSINAWDVINDIWEWSGEYNFTANTGANYSFSSSDVDDNQPIEFTVHTVDSNNNWNMEQFTQNIAGQTKTELTPPSGDPVVRILRMESLADDWDWPNQWSIEGTFYCYESTATVVGGVPQEANLIRSIIINGSNQTQQLIYTVPTGYVGFLLRWEAWAWRWQGTDQLKMQYRSRRYWKIFKTKKSFTLMTGWSSIYRDVRSIKDPIPAQTDLLLRSVYASWNNMEAWGAFDILLVDERQLADTYLQAIGQVKRVGDYPSPILNIW